MNFVIVVSALALFLFEIGDASRQKHLEGEAAHRKSGKIHCRCNNKTGNPVCGSDGVTYDNLCHWQCAHQQDNKIKLADQEPCPSSQETTEGDILKPEGDVPESTEPIVAEVDEEECVCPRIYIPVCGTNGIKYSNMCELKCVTDKDPSVTLANKGPCKPQEGSGPKGRSYDGPSEPTDGNEDPCACELELPVMHRMCASNGKTYRNQCKFDCGVYKSNDTTSYLVHDGICRKPRPGHASPSDDDSGDKAAHKEACKCRPEDLPAHDNEPVCSGDGVTYFSKCALKCDSEKDPLVHLAFCGPCIKTHRCHRGGAAAKSRLMMD